MSNDRRRGGWRCNDTHSLTHSLTGGCNRFRRLVALSRMSLLRGLSPGVLRLALFLVCTKKNRVYFFIRHSSNSNENKNNSPENSSLKVVEKHLPLAGYYFVSPNPENKSFPRFPPSKRLLVGCSSPSMRLADHLTALRAWC